jgi:hypothetical protein
MALYYDLPIYKASYSLLLNLFRLTRTFNREYKYTLGQEMKTNAMKMVQFIFNANTSRDKLPALSSLSNHFELLRLQLRLCNDMHLINSVQYAAIWEQMDEIGKQLTGWQKASRSYEL